MGKMVERVAKALEDRLAEEFSITDVQARAFARIAIEAMREPTDEMISAADVHWGYSLAMDYRTMIDAALGKVDS